MQSRVQQAAHSFCYGHKPAQSRAATCFHNASCCSPTCSACGRAGLASHTEQDSKPLQILQRTFFFLFLILRFQDWNDHNVVQHSLLLSFSGFSETGIPCPVLSVWLVSCAEVKDRISICCGLSFIVRDAWKSPLSPIIGIKGWSHWNNLLFVCLFLLIWLSFEAYDLTRVLRLNCGLDSTPVQYSG